MATYNPAAPWAVGDEVTDTDTGLVWVATGANSLKKQPVIITTPEDCCHYVEVVTDILDPADPPPPEFLPPGKSDGDTLTVEFPNGYCTYTCAGGVWVLDKCRCIQEQLRKCRQSDGQSLILPKDERVIVPENLICFRRVWGSNATRFSFNAAAATVGDPSELGPLVCTTIENPSNCDTMEFGNEWAMDVFHWTSPGKGFTSEIDLKWSTDQGPIGSTAPNPTMQEVTGNFQSTVPPNNCQPQYQQHNSLTRSGLSFILNPGEEVTACIQLCARLFDAGGNAIQPTEAFAVVQPRVIVTTIGSICNQRAF